MKNILDLLVTRFEKRSSYTHCGDPGSEQATWNLCIQYNVNN
jgi:hypothetical protein